MPTSTYTPLATVTLGASASSVTFSSIPATYRDLILLATGTTTSAQNLFLRFNSDSGSNYSHVGMFANSGGNGSFSGTTTSISQGGIGTAESNNTFQIMDYSATDKHKTVLVRFGVGGNVVQASAERWANTAAITTILAFPSGSTQFLTGTILSLYGIAS
jgi:hypothetical protein